VAGWRRQEELSKPFTASIDCPLLDGVTALAVQSYFCWRIYILSGVKWWPLLLLLFTLLQGSLAIASGIKAALINDLRRVPTEDGLLTSAWLIACVVADTLIAISTVWLLLRRRDKGTKIAQSTVLISKIVKLTIETNAVTAAVAILSLVLFVGFPVCSTVFLFFLPMVA
jgi:hypothetical protein